ncbi:MAG: hypothetical protein ABF876_05300 [Acetobacter aceti]
MGDRKSNTPWVQTYMGKAVDLINTVPEAINLTDIAVHLSRNNRFNGATTIDCWSVADHSMLVRRVIMTMNSDADPFLEAYALLHDAHEAYTGDITSPVKQALNVILRHAGCEIDPVEMLATHVQSAIHQRFGLPVHPSAAQKQAIADADLMALAIEKRAFMGPEPRPWLDTLPHELPVDPLPDAPRISAYVFSMTLKDIMMRAGLPVSYEAEVGS